ncbi:MAG: tetratricopeptide repeat protein [Pseudanabaenaceae cyanobacterium bins.68]|nr:tetratricopeptide repeat protein [Pseudanabaenaceae cyanobacterium bins.68]
MDGRQLLAVISLIILLNLPIPWAEGASQVQHQVRQLNSQETRQLDQLAKQAVGATNAGDFATAELYWTEIIQAFPFNAAAWSNRGNARVSQNLLEPAIADYNQAIQLAPDALDPYLNRGTAYEGLGKFELAIADYDHILALDPQDPMAWNNHGNALAGLGKWEQALRDYQKAADLAPSFAFARANQAIALYQMGETAKALTQMRNILRKYPDFPDVRAAYSVALWAEGKIGEAESNWVSVEKLDRRYLDLNWVQQVRRWPPRLVLALSQFLRLDFPTDK